VTRAAVLALLIWAPAAIGEAAWLTARGRLAPALRVEAFGGLRSLGAGVVLPDAATADAPEPRAAFALEGQWSYADRAAEVRGTRVWQFTSSGVATASATAGVSLLLVPVGDVDLGLGPHGGLTLSLGGRTFSVDLGLQAGVEFFGRRPPCRVPLRAVLGLNLIVGPVSVSLLARGGADLQPGAFFVMRGDFVLSLGWLRA
jgi:hypothetical protein